jgi:peptidoglycan/LPS O-acetylase OafA/YrhL
MPSREHFLTLDFLRGVAAFCVLQYHWFNGQQLPLFGLGYLAVDFFFVLSGFVIAYSYEDRLKADLSFGRFTLTRLIRLHPMIIAAIVFGLIRIVLCGAAAPKFAVDSGTLAWCSLLTFFMIPYISNGTFSTGLFPINGVLWSLFFEPVANFVYAGLVKYLKLPVLVGIVAISFFCLLGVAAVRGGLDGGFNIENWHVGIPRIFFSFTMGILLYRLRLQLPILRKPILDGYALAAILVVILALPSAGTAYFQVAVVAVVFPVFVIIGANDVQHGWAAKVAALSGALSYPLYAIHLPLLWLVTGTLKAAHVYSRVDPKLLAIPVGVGIGVIAWSVLKVYDEPVRAWLTGRFIRRQPRKELGIQPAQ